MEAGHSLDKLIATQVMGWTYEKASNFKNAIFFTENFVPVDVVSCDPQGNPKPIPKYSTDIAAAWQVVEKTNLLMGRELTQDDKTKKWMIGHGSDGYRFESEFPEGDTAAHVICLAALNPTWCRAREDWIYPS